MSDRHPWGPSDAYGILGIPPDADERTVKRAYRRFAKTHHPDVNPNDPGAEKRFRDIQQAYDLIVQTHDRSTSDRWSTEVHGSFSVYEEVHPFVGFYEALRRSGMLKKKT